MYVVGGLRLTVVAAQCVKLVVRFYRCSLTQLSFNNFTQQYTCMMCTWLTVAQRVLARHHSESLMLDRARVNVRLVDGAVCGASLNGSCAIEVMGA